MNSTSAIWATHIWADVVGYEVHADLCRVGQQVRSQQGYFMLEQERAHLEYQSTTCRSSRAQVLVLQTARRRERSASARTPAVEHG